MKSRKNRLLDTDVIVLYDDAPYNIDPFRESLPLLKSILVPANKPYNQILKGKPSSLYAEMYLKKYKNNKYAKELVKRMTVHMSYVACQECNSTTGQGISIKEMKNISKWAAHKTKHDKIILFDWDQTLSVCGGIHMPVDTNLDKDTEDVLKQKLFTEEEVSRYCAGTTERFESLKQMFSVIRTNNVSCRILTNNGWGNNVKTKYLQSNVFFLKMLQTIDPWMKDTEIIYGRVDGKVKKFKDDAFLMKHYKTLKKR
jgi:hypothetical protein